MSASRELTSGFFRQTQMAICKALEEVDGKATFKEDAWDRVDVQGGHGGGGFSRVMTNGKIFEKAGVNFSSVQGFLPADYAKKLELGEKELPFYATGVSLVLHPNSPMIPTTHANWRYLEAGDRWWFGGGSDLTPYYPFVEDCKHFHNVLKEVCDRHDNSYYPKFKKWCDEYFYLPHRKEHRGIGGIFFDYLGKDGSRNFDSLFPFVKDLASNFVQQYCPIANRRKDLNYSPEQREFQLLRRGRYVEFNLLYDRGTQFGLQTGGRTESILMSLPPLVRWEYDYSPVAGSSEAELLEIVKNVREWLE